MARKVRMPTYAWVAVIGGILLVIAYMTAPVVMGSQMCPGSQVYCPGVGCVSGQDKCFPGAKGGPTKVFSKETFISKTCKDGTRSDGPCLME